MTNNIIHYATASVQSLLYDTLCDFLQNIANDYDISYEELKYRYLDSSSIKRKRGPKKKIPDEYIETEEIEYQGETYLVDNNNIVYSNNVKNPVILGKRKNDGTIIFIHDD